MSLTAHNVYFTISSGQTISDDVHVSKAEKVSLYVPVISSAQLMLKVSHAHTGDFYRVQNTAGNSDQAYDVAAGGVVLALADKFAGLSHVKVEFSAAQTDVRTMVLMCKV